MSSTPDKAQTMFGNKPYQQRARKALPLLVRQAKKRETVTYTDISRKLGMPNSRNMNYVLGSIGKTLIELSEKWEIKIPPIDCLVVKKDTDLPGDGIADFLDCDYSTLSKKEKESVVNDFLEEIFDFPKWDKVLIDLSLPPV